MPRIRLSLTEHPKEFHEFHPIGGVAATESVPGSWPSDTWPSDTRNDATGGDAATADGIPAPATAAAPSTAVAKTNRSLSVADMGRLRRSAVPITDRPPR
jgi:hypothetical protein